LIGILGVVLDTRAVHVLGDKTRNVLPSDLAPAAAAVDSDSEEAAA